LIRQTVNILKITAQLSERLSTVAALIRLALFDAAFPHQLPAHLAKESLFVRGIQTPR
jgi:hypothetical protein